MLHLIYILAFTVLAVLAVVNLVRNLMMLGMESQRSYRVPNAPRRPDQVSPYDGDRDSIHPELLDESGNVVSEPFLVMRSITVEDARERLDALYNSSPGSTSEAQDD